MSRKVATAWKLREASYSALNTIMGSLNGVGRELLAEVIKNLEPCEFLEVPESVSIEDTQSYANLNEVARIFSKQN